LRRSCHVTAGPRDIGNKPELHWITASREDDWNCSRGSFCDQCGRRAGGSNDSHAPVDQIGRQIRQPFVLPIRPPVFDQDILPFDKAHLAQTTAKLVRKFLVVVRCRGIEETNHRYPAGLLSARASSPRHKWTRHGTPKKCDELAPSHCLPQAQDGQRINSD